MVDMGLCGLVGKDTSTPTQYTKLHVGILHGSFMSTQSSSIVPITLFECVYVCVCERERGRERPCVSSKLQLLLFQCVADLEKFPLLLSGVGFQLLKLGVMGKEKK